MLDFKAKMHPIQFWLRLDPAGELTALPRPPRGLLLREGQRKGEEKESDGKGGRKRKGIGPQVTVTTRGQHAAGGVNYARGRSNMT